MTAPARQPADTWALTSDGTTVHLRTPEPGDADRVFHMFRGMSPESLRRRFLGGSGSAVVETSVRVCAPARPGRGALVAEHGEAIVAVGEYVVADVPGEAELGLAVADGWHGRGLGTLLVEHLAPAARAEGVRAFVADAFPDNEAIRRVFADLGLPVRADIAEGVARYRVDLDVDRADRAYEDYLTALAEREEHADVASLRPLFAPRSVAVAGAGRSPASTGRALLRALRDGGFTGPVHVLHPSESSIDGVPAVADPADLPEPPDLVVVAVPAHALLDLAERCGRAGARALLVITAGVDPVARADLRALCRRHGMRMIGPNCLGVANTDPAVRLDATFSGLRPAPGTVGLAVQSGGIGIALAEHLGRLGIGVSTLASLGDKADVSGNDLLRWWDADDRTSIAVLHLESFGNPRKFSRIARRMTRRIPILTVDAGRSDAGRRAAAAHTGAGRTPEFAREALFAQAGVTSTRGLADLVAVAALLHEAPLPAGPAVAVIGNTAGAGVLAADALSDAGLTVPAFDAALRRDLEMLLPPGASCVNPVDTGPVVTGEALSACAAAITASGQADAVVFAVTPTALGDPLAGLRVPRREIRACPVVAVSAGQPETVTLRGAEGERYPVYADAGTAATALAHAVARARHLARPAGTVPALDRVDPARARAVVEHALADRPGGGQVLPAECADLLGAYGLPLAPAAADGGPAVRLRARITQDEAFGPLLVLLPEGVTRAAAAVVRLTPLTDLDARDMLTELRLRPEFRDAPATDTGALADLLHRVCRLAEDHPEIVEIDLDPVVAGATGALAAAARITLAPPGTPATLLPRLS